jgi:hypothetical protein
MSENTSDKIVQIPCRHLRSKEMFHQEIGESDDHECASGLYWCGRSQESFGPDGEAVEKSSCCQGRSCYQS